MKFLERKQVYNFDNFDLFVTSGNDTGNDSVLCHTIVHYSILISGQRSDERWRLFRSLFQIDIVLLRFFIYFVYFSVGILNNGLSYVCLMEPDSEKLKALLKSTLDEVLDSKLKSIFTSVKFKSIIKHIFDDTLDSKLQPLIDSAQFISKQHDEIIKKFNTLEESSRILKHDNQLY
jgi:hypothetical protein